MDEKSDQKFYEQKIKNEWIELLIFIDILEYSFAVVVEMTFTSMLPVQYSFSLYLSRCASCFKVFLTWKKIKIFPNKMEQQSKQTKK